MSSCDANARAKVLLRYPPLSQWSVMRELPTLEKIVNSSNTSHILESVLDLAHGLLGKPVVTDRLQVCALR